MLEIIRDINNYVCRDGTKLGYWQQFHPDRTHLYDFTETNLYPTIEDDWIVYGGFIPESNMEIVRTARWVNNNVYYPILREVLQGHGTYLANVTTYVKLRIAINTINKLSLTKTQKDKWIAHIADTYWMRKRVLADYYVDRYLPF